MEAENKIYDLLIDYLNNSLDGDDLCIVEQWINESEINKSKFEDIKRIWKNKSSKGGKKFGWNKVLKQMKAREPKPILLKPNFTRYAALLMLLIGIVGYLYTHKKEGFTIIATDTNFLTDTLKNGCVLYLYPSSELIQTKGNKSTDEYTLNGEAFFIVPPKSGKDIFISMDNARLKVAKTSFRARSCNNNSDVAITVESGNVQLSNKNKPAESLQVNAGEKGYYSCNEQNIWKQKNNDNIYIIYQPENVTINN